MKTDSRLTGATGGGLGGRFVLAALVCIIAVGCRNNAVPVPPPSPPAAAVSPDEKVLLALDYYEPMYQVDGNGRVTRLRMNWRHLPPSVLAEIGKLTELRQVDFYGTTVTDEGLAQFKDLQNLTNLGLGATPITDKGLPHLEKLQSLQYLWLPRRTVSKEGVEALKQARPDLHVYLQ